MKKVIFYQRTFFEHLIFNRRLFLLGYMSRGKKRYGMFFLAVQTYSKHIFVLPIKNAGGPALIQAIEQLVKVRPIVLLSKSMHPVLIFLFKNVCR